MLFILRILFNTDIDSVMFDEPVFSCWKTRNVSAAAWIWSKMSVFFTSHRWFSWVLISFTGLLTTKPNKKHQSFICGHFNLRQHAEIRHKSSKYSQLHSKLWCPHTFGWMLSFFWRWALNATKTYRWHNERFFWERYSLRESNLWPLRPVAPPLFSLWLIWTWVSL